MKKLFLCLILFCLSMACFIDKSESYTAMRKEVYDSNANGYVDAAENLTDGNHVITGNLSVGNNLEVTGATISTTIDTGQGNNELYDMDQNTLTTSSMQLKDLSITRNLAVDTSTLYVDAVSNRVGIGTSSPSEVFDIIGNVQVTSILKIGNDSDYSTISSLTSPYDLTVYVQGDDCVSLGTYYGENKYYLNVIDNGNVGIGTTSPDAKFDVEETTASSTDMFNVNVTHSGFSGDLLQLNNATTSGVFTVDKSGYCGINDNTPGTNLDVDGTIWWGTDKGILESSGNNVVIRTYVAGASIIFDRYVTGSKVGIGITSPASILHVNGDAQIETSLSVANCLYVDPTPDGTSLNIGLDLTTDGTNLYFKGEKITSH